MRERLPRVPEAVGGPSGEGTCTPPDESPYLKVIRVPLSLPDGAPNGTVTLVLRIAAAGDAIGSFCPYRFDLHLKCIELGEEDGDPGLRGPGDLFPADGLLIGSQDCLAPCGLANFPIAANLVLRSHNRVALIDLLGGFFWVPRKADPAAEPLWETAVGLSRDYGPEPGPGRCRGEGHAELTPPLYPVWISSVTIPGWATFQPGQGMGHALTECTFPAPDPE